MSGIKSLLRFEGTDASTTFTDDANLVTWTASGGAEIDTAAYKFGSSSGYFPTSPSYITPSSVTPFAFDSDDFTIEFWARINDINIAYMFGNLGQNIYIAQLTNFIYFAYYIGATSYYVAVSGMAADSQFHHVAVVRFGSSLKIYKDGVAGSPANIGSSSLVNLSTVYLGATFSNNRLNGWMDEFRFMKGARYKANFNPASIIALRGTSPNLIMAG